MKVILREDVSGLGRSGDVKDVKDGFARNFLFPKKLALEACKHNLEKIELEHKKRETQQALEKKKAQELAGRFENFSVTIPVEVNEDENLYGSLNAQDIAKAISQEGASIDKKNIIMKEPIKALGIYDLELKLYADVVAKIKVWVVKK